MGRPSEFNAEIADQIVERLAGGDSLRAIQRDGGPEPGTVSRWRAANEDFDRRCARAKAAGIEAKIDGIEEIEAGVLSGDIDPAAARVVISSIQWRAEKLKPKTYGAKVELSGNAEQPLQVVINRMGEKGDAST